MIAIRIGNVKDVIFAICKSQSHISTWRCYTFSNASGVIITFRHNRLEDNSLLLKMVGGSYRTSKYSVNFVVISNQGQVFARRLFAGNCLSAIVRPMESPLGSRNLLIAFPNKQFFKVCTGYFGSI